MCTIHNRRYWFSYNTWHDFDEGHNVFETSLSSFCQSIMSVAYSSNKIKERVHLNLWKEFKLWFWRKKKRNSSLLHISISCLIEILHYKNHTYCSKIFLDPRVLILPYVIEIVAIVFLSLTWKQKTNDFCLLLHSKNCYYNQLILTKLYCWR